MNQYGQNFVCCNFRALRKLISLSGQWSMLVSIPLMCSRKASFVTIFCLQFVFFVYRRGILLITFFFHVNIHKCFGPNYLLFSNFDGFSHSSRRILSFISYLVLQFLYRLISFGLMQLKPFFLSCGKEINAFFKIFIIRVGLILMRIY